MKFLPTWISKWNYYKAEAFKNHSNSTMKQQTVWSYRASLSSKPPLKKAISPHRPTLAEDICNSKRYNKSVTLLFINFKITSVCKYLSELCKKNAVLHKNRALFCPNSLSWLWGEKLHLVQSHMPRAFILGCWHIHRQLETWWPSSHSCHTWNRLDVSCLGACIAGALQCKFPTEKAHTESTLTV